MRALVLVLGLLGCEKSKAVEPSPPIPAPPPGPQPLLLPPEPPPVKTLPGQEIDEIRAILDGKGTFDHELVATDPNKRVDPNWDPRRVWLRRFEQRGQAITIKGEATDNPDITQFAKRLAADVYFKDVTLMSGSRKGTIYEFEIRLKARNADPNGPALTETFERPR